MGDKRGKADKREDFLLEYEFKDISLYELALTHSSRGLLKKRSRVRAEEVGGDVLPCENNERLEFLGDRILGFVIAESLYREFSEDNEGLLSIKLAELVNRESLAGIARRRGIDILLEKRLDMSDGELVNNDSVISDAMEAIIAAVYLDGGWDEVREFIQKLWKESIELLRTKGINEIKDKKTQLQEFCHKRLMSPPEYVLVSQEGEAHEPIFLVELRLEGEAISRAEASNKKRAEHEAARIALDILTKDGDKDD